MKYPVLDRGIAEGVLDVRFLVRCCRLRLGASAKLGVRSHFVGVERGGAAGASCCWEYTTIFLSSTSAGYMVRYCFE